GLSADRSPLVPAGPPCRFASIVTPSRTPAAEGGLVLGACGRGTGRLVSFVAMRVLLPRPGPIERALWPVVPLAPAAPAVRPSRTAVPRARPAGPRPRSALAAIATVSVVIIVVVERAEHLGERRRHLRLVELS